MFCRWTSRLSYALALAVSLTALAGSVRAAADPARVDAVRAGESVTDLLAAGADPNERAADGSTALLWASYRDDIDTLARLLEAGANPDLANDLGATPLWAASENGGEAVVEALLGAGADPNLALWSGETPLMVASRSGHTEVASALLEHGADTEARATRDQTALMWAAAQKHPDTVRVLLEAGADVHARSATWELVEAVPPHSYRDYNKSIPHGSNTALLFAAQVGDLESARLLVSAGADVDDQTAWGVSALTLAAHSGFSDLARFLLEESADPNQSGPGFNALHLAVMRRDATLIDALLAHGADPEIPIGTWTPLRRTSSDFHLPPELIGATPYWLAARFQEPAIMRSLAEHGADTGIVHRGEYVVDGYTAAMHEPRANTTTALMAALGMGRGSAWVAADRAADADANTLEAVRVALEFGGFDIDLADTDGRTAIDAAARMRIDGLADLLVAAGAEPPPVEEAPPAGGRGGRGAGAALPIR